MARSKEIPRNLRKQVVDAHQAGKGYKTISKQFGLHQSTVRQIVYKWRKFSTIATLPRSGRLAKITPRARRIIFQEVTKKTSTVAGAALLPQDQGGLPSLTEL